MDFIGLDLGSYSLKAVQLKKGEGKNLKLLNYASSPAPSYSLSSESKEEISNYAKSLRDFITSSKFATLNIVTALPESQIFTRVISFPKMSKKELSSAISYEAEQYIPPPQEEVSMDYQVVREEKDKMDVLLIAAPKILVKKYMDILERAGLTPVGIESETLAIVRSLIKDKESPVTLLVSLGAKTTDLSIVSEGAIWFTRSISTGGEALARAISQELGFDLNQAEEYKRSYGLEEAKLEGKVMEAIKPIFDVIVSEIRKAIVYHKTHGRKGEVKRVILCGGTANLPGVLVYLAASLGIEVQLGNPWEGIEAPSNFSREELEEIGPSFAVAVGLALKEI